MRYPTRGYQTDHTVDARPALAICRRGEVVQITEHVAQLHHVAKLIGRLVLEMVRLVDDQMLVLRKHLT